MPDDSLYCIIMHGEACWHMSIIVPLQQYYGSNNGPLYLSSSPVGMELGAVYLPSSACLHSVAHAISVILIVQPACLETRNSGAAQAWPNMMLASVARRHGHTAGAPCTSVLSTSGNSRSVPDTQLRCYSFCLSNIR